MTIYILDIDILDFEPVFCSMSSSNCCFLSCIQVSQETGNVVWYSISLRIFQFVVIHTVKDCSMVNEVEEMLFWNSLAFSVIQLDVGDLISGSSAFSTSSLNIGKFVVHVLLNPGVENFEHY